LSEHTPASSPSRPRPTRARRLWSLTGVRLPDRSGNDLPASHEAMAELSWLLVIAALGFLLFAQHEIEPGTVTAILGGVLVYALVVLLLQVLKPVRSTSQWFATARTWAMIALITWILWIAGEGRGALANLYLLAIVASALTLGAGITAINFVLIAACVVLLGQREAGTAEDRMLLVFLQIAPMLLVAYFALRLGTDMRKAMNRIRFVSETDELTRLFNLRAFMDIAERLHRQAKRYKRPYALVMIDSDNLKSVNDTHGHDAGNDLLRITTLGIRRLLRETDVAARYGGDEFILLLPETHAQGARELAERIRRTIERKPLEVRGMRINTSVSLGVASFPEHGEDLRSILNKADQAMYLSKKTGRNRVTVFDPG